MPDDDLDEGIPGEDMALVGQCLSLHVGEYTNTGSSHLAMRGAPVKAIQELAGHRELGMTQRYMHLSPAALDNAIRLLDQTFVLQDFGDLGETGTVPEGQVNG